MTSDKLVDFDQRRNGTGACQPTNLNEPAIIGTAVDGTKIKLGDNMGGVAYCRELRDTSLESRDRMTFADKLYGHPAVAVLFNLHETFRNCARAHLGNHAIEIYETERNSDKSADLAHPVALSFDETKSRYGSLSQLNPD